MGASRNRTKVTCTVCRESFESARSTRKYCDGCRPVVNGLSMRERRSSCHGCDESIYRLNGDMRFCTECRLAGVGEKPTIMESACTCCGLTGQPALGAGLSVCAACVERVDHEEPDHERRMHKWLLAEKRKRAAKERQTKQAAPARRDDTAAAKRREMHVQQAPIVFRKEMSYEDFEFAQAVQQQFEESEESDFPAWILGQYTTALDNDPDLAPRDWLERQKAGQ